MGIGSGCLIHIAAAAIGLYSILAVSPLSFTAICLAGGLYLIYLGIMIIVNRIIPNRFLVQVRKKKIYGRYTGRVYSQTC